MPMKPPVLRDRAHGQAQRDYERSRGSARQRGYSGKWDQLSKAYRVRHPFCVGCQAIGVLRATEVVDHIVPHKGDMALFWASDNRQPSCKWHHDDIKQRLERAVAAKRMPMTALRLDSPEAIRLTQAHLLPGTA